MRQRSWRVQAGSLSHIDGQNCCHRRSSRERFVQSLDWKCFDDDDDDVDSCSRCYVKVNWWLNCFGYTTLPNKSSTVDSAAVFCLSRAGIALCRLAEDCICVRDRSHRVHLKSGDFFRQLIHSVLLWEAPPKHFLFSDSCRLLPHYSSVLSSPFYYNYNYLTECLQQRTLSRRCIGIFIHCVGEHVWFVAISRKDWISLHRSSQFVTLLEKSSGGVVGGVSLMEIRNYWRIQNDKFG